MGAAAGDKRVVGFSSFPSPSSPRHSLPASKLGLPTPQEDSALPTGLRNELPDGDHVPCHDGHGMGELQGKGGRPSLPPPTSASESMDKAESEPKAMGEGLSPPISSVASFVDSSSPVACVLVACQEGGQGKEGFPPQIGPPRVESVLGGLGSFVAGNPQLPPMGSENLAGQKGLGESINGVSVEARVGHEVGTGKGSPRAGEQTPPWESKSGWNKRGETAGGNEQPASRISQSQS